MINLGEIYELKAELNSDKRERKKEALKKVIKIYFSTVMNFYNYYFRLSLV